jgi:hypothetical protein
VTPPTNKWRSPRLSDAQLFVLQLLFTWQHHHGDSGGATRGDLGNAQHQTLAVLLERGLVESYRSLVWRDLTTGEPAPGYRLTPLGRQVLEREDRAI